MLYIFIPLVFISLVFIGNISISTMTYAIFNKKFLSKYTVVVLVGSVLYVVSLVLAMRYSYEILRVLFFYFGFLNYFAISALIYWILFAIASLFRKKNILRGKRIFMIFVIIPLLISVYGIFNFFKPIVIESVYLNSEKITQDYTFLHVSDIQYGTVTKKYFQKVIDTINKQNVDFVVFTGDLVDFNFYSEEDLLMLGQIKVPIYFERGNHEFYHFPDKILASLEKLGNTEVLINEKSAFKEIDIFGIDYQRQKGVYKQSMETLNINPNRFSMLLYHEPKFVEYSADKGFDLMLYGHTHAGQIWPFTWLVDLIYTYSDGLFMIADTTVYVSDGVALWGPRMRVGSQNEMVLFKLNKK